MWTVHAECISHPSQAVLPGGAVAGRCHMLRPQLAGFSCAGPSLSGMPVMFPKLLERCGQAGHGTYPPKSGWRFSSTMAQATHGFAHLNYEEKTVTMGISLMVLSSVAGLFKRLSVD